MVKEEDNSMTAANIATFIRGAHHLVARPDGLVRPSRMSDKQLEAAAAAGRERAARTTAGITIDLVTTGDEVSFDLTVLKGIRMESASVQKTIELAEAVAHADAQLAAADADKGAEAAGEDDAETTAQAEATERAEDGAAPEALAPEAGLVDGVDLVVDGTYVRTVPVREGAVTLAFDNPNHQPAEVRVYLPCLMTVAVGNLSTNGSIERAPKRGYLLALGDSITQGYVVGSPSASWPARVARACGLDLVNQAIAGHHFDIHTLRGMKALRENPPAAIVVAYGTNDWAHTDTKRELVANMTKYLGRLAERFQETPVYVLSPIWRADEGEPRPHGRTLAWWRDTLRDECQRLGLRYVDGTELVPADTSLYADGRLHPNATGAEHLAEGVLEAFDHDGLLAALGGRHDTPAALADAQTLLRSDAPRRQRTLEQAARTIWRLRQPDGCPWDKEQTHASIKKNMIEEAFEVVDAIEAGDAAHLCEELGDVLMQVLLHAQIAEDAGEFTFADVCRDLDDKLVRRHPHVFGYGESASSADEVLGIWSKVKLAEHRAEEDAARASGDAAEADAADVASDAASPAKPQGLLDSVPRSMPALMQAQKVSKKAAACGFDWDSTTDVWKKVDEERGEFLAEKPGSPEALEEFGDVLFAAVNVARKEHLDAETALRASCDKFRERWASMEAAAASEGRSVEDLSRDELEELWNKAKDGVSERA